jgi:hypothetical protein
VQLARRQRFLLKIILVTLRIFVSAGILCQTDNINHQYNSFADGSDKKTAEGSSPSLTKDDTNKDSVSFEEQVSSHTMCLTVTHRM